jgi:hypothetical protein
MAELYHLVKMVYTYLERCDSMNRLPGSRRNGLIALAATLAALLLASLLNAPQAVMILITVAGLVAVGYMMLSPKE